MIPDKGQGYLDHLIRQTRMHHMQLSAMADVKANILLTMASVVLTLSIRYISDPQLKWPVLILIAFCLLTIVLATYAVMPKLPITHKNHSLECVDDPEFNPLFFGHFVGMSFQDYEKTMDYFMQSAERSYQLQIREVYSLGVFLAKKKYRFIRMAYLAFIVGFLACGVGIIVNSVAA